MKSSAIREGWCEVVIPESLYMNASFDGSPRPFLLESGHLLLRAPVDDISILTAINKEVGGPRFAIVSADAARLFSGDGAFRLKANRLVPVA